MSLNYEAELYKGGLLTTVKVMKHEYDNIEVTFKRNLTSETGKPIIDSSFTMFYTEREFREFFLPLINEMKVRFENDPKPSN
jgi:hypothetical protein